jgi:hypothetical protein
MNFFDVEWTLKDTYLQQSHHLKLLKIKKYILGKFQCISLLNSSFDDVYFILFYFDTILTFF